MDALHTPIVGETPEARAFEVVRLANLAERTRLDNLQRALDERAQERSMSPVDNSFSHPHLRYTALRFKISQL